MADIDVALAARYLVEKFGQTPEQAAETIDLLLDEGRTEEFRRGLAEFVAGLPHRLDGPPAT